MLGKITFFVLLTFIQQIFGAIILNEQASVVSELKSRLNDIWRCKNDKQAVILGDSSNDMEEVMDWFLTKTNSAYVANREGVKTVCDSIATEFVSIFIFASSREQALEYIYLVNISYVHNALFFIVHWTSQSEKANGGENLLESIWHAFNFLNCFLITCDNSTQVTTYNPFFKKTVVFVEKQIEKCEIFIDKLKDLNGYNLKIALFLDPPRTIMHNGRFDGRNVRFMNLVLEVMNATAEIVIPKKKNGSYFSAANVAAAARTIDVSFMEHFTTRVVGKNQSFSYPLNMDDFIVVVRKGSTIVNYFNVYEIFDFYTWMCLVSCLLLITGFRKISERRSDVCICFMHVWSALTANSLDSMFRTSKMVKLVFTVWVMSCLVINIIFASLLASKIIKPKIRRNIDKIEELRALNPKILISHKFIDVIPKEYGISKNLVAANHLERQEALQNIDDNTAVVVANTVLEVIRDRSNLHVLKEHLLPGFSMYRFQSKSPYKLKINKIIFKNVEYGLTKFNENYTVKHSQKHAKKKESLLGLVHLRDIFLILVIGHSFAVTAFILEISIEILRRRSIYYAD